jgi:hypothetical protein
MKFKIHGGSMAQPDKFLKPKHVGKRFKHKHFATMFGVFQHHYESDWGNPTVVNVGTEIESAEIITEDNKVNFMGAAGWGIVGGLLTGGVGLLAGAVLGGRGKETYCALRFKDGSQFVVSGKPKDVVALMAR